LPNKDKPGLCFIYARQLLWPRVFFQKEFKTSILIISSFYSSFFMIPSLINRVVIWFRTCLRGLFVGEDSLGGREDVLLRVGTGFKNK